jgi:hypothetical protein
MLRIPFGVVFLAGALRVLAIPDFTQGFETGTSHWHDSSTGWTGTLQRVASGTDGIASAAGSWHAVMNGSPLYDGTLPVGPYSGYGTDNSFNPAALVSLDVYLDSTGWGLGTGFDLTTAMSNQAGAHLRDYMFHVGVVDDGGGAQLLVNASTYSAYEVDSGFLPAESSYAVTTSGWYTFEFDVQNGGGFLALDLNLRDSAGLLLWSADIGAPQDLIATVAGGPYYTWFAFVDTNNGVLDGVAVDNHIYRVPEPSTLVALLLVLALGGLSRTSRRIA